MDSGASRHYEPNRANFVSIRECDPYYIEVANGNCEKADVYYTPWMSNSLISLTQLRREGVFFSNRKHGHASLINISTGEMILKVTEDHGMYPIKTVMEAHARLGHISPDAVRKLVKDGMVTGLNVDLNTPNEDRLLDQQNPLIGYGATCGGHPIKKPREDTVTTCHLQTTIHEVIFGNGQDTVQLGNTDASLRPRWRVPISHDTPEMNGVAERLNYTLVNLVRAILAASKLPKSMWGYALRYATWVKNRNTRNQT